jgi:thiosulfate/3-mercaptopyruvate sulfurtransferase
MATSRKRGVDGEPGPLVTTQWLADHLDDPRLRVFDTTSRIGQDPTTGEVQMASGHEDWTRCHIPGSGFMDLLELADPTQPGRHMLPSAEDFAAAMSGLGVGPDTHVVVYDSGAAMFATRLWWALRVFGFDAVSVLDGGMRTWSEEGRATSDDPCRYPPARFEASFRPELRATLEQVESYVGAGDACLVNALSPEAFRGEGTVGYRRPGRIPSSANVPFYGLLQEGASRFLPPQQLSELLAAAGVLDEGKPVVTYCGGGFAATTVAFAFSLVGREDIAVYDGSLNEWTADSDRPVEVG